MNRANKNYVIEDVCEKKTKQNTAMKAKHTKKNWFWELALETPKFIASRSSIDPYKLNEYVKI